MKIKRIIASGSLYPNFETTDGLVNGVSRIIEKSSIYDSIGTVYFEGEDGKFYTVGVTVELFETSKEEVDNYLEFEKEWLDKAAS